MKVLNTVSLEKCPVADCPGRMNVTESCLIKDLGDRGYKSIAEELIGLAPNVRVRIHRCVKCQTRVLSGEWALAVIDPAVRTRTPTFIRRFPCRVCNQTGRIKDQPCTRCNGTGLIDA